MELSLSKKIESYLFYKGEGVTKKEVMQVFGIKEEELNNAISELKNSLEGRGITLVQNESTLMLGTAKEMAEFFKNIRKQELERDLSKAAMETLSIILYKKGGVTKSEIDYIRGVNGSYILRNLSVRGLIERKQNPKDARTFVYGPTVELLSFMGISDSSELPDYENMTALLEDSLVKETE